MKWLILFAIVFSLLVLSLQNSPPIDSGHLPLLPELQFDLGQTQA